MIDDEIVFKCAMTREYSKIVELNIVSEGITFIDNGNLLLKSMGPSLRKLDLSFNKLKRIEGLDCLP